MSLYEAMCTLMPNLKMLLEVFLVIQLTSVQIKEVSFIPGLSVIKRKLQKITRQGN